MNRLKRISAKGKIVIAAAAVIAAAISIQAGRHMRTYPVSPLPSGNGVGSTLYIASCEPYHPYLEEHSAGWFYLFQAPLDEEGFDDTVEKLIYSSSAVPVHMRNIYTVETYRADPAYPGAEIVSREVLLWRAGTYTQKRLNALAPMTSENHPLYLVWCGGNLYGVIDDDAYLLWHGKDKPFLLSLPEFQKDRHTPYVAGLGPITEADYAEAPDSPSS